MEPDGFPSLYVVAGVVAFIVIFVVAWLFVRRAAKGNRRLGLWQRRGGG